MTINLRSLTLIGVTVAGIGLLTITAVPSVANSHDEMKENSSSYLRIAKNISNQNYDLTAFKSTNKSTFFKRSPHLIDTANTHKTTYNSAATYYFTIEVPSDAGAALKAIQIEQRGNLGEIVTFKPQENRAVTGDNFAGGKPLSLAAVGGAEESAGTVTVVFSRPIYPGNTVTVAVKPKRNPSIGGIYLFGVTAYPDGVNSQGLYLGVSRVHIRND